MRAADKPVMRAMARFDERRNGMRMADILPRIPKDASREMKYRSEQKRSLHESEDSMVLEWMKRPLP